MPTLISAAGRSRCRRTTNQPPVLTEHIQTRPVAHHVPVNVDESVGPRRNAVELWVTLLCVSAVTEKHRGRHPTNSSNPDDQHREQSSTVNTCAVLSIDCEKTRHPACGEQREATEYSLLLTLT